MLVVLDTNIFVADFALDSPAFETLLAGAPRAGHSLLLPDLVLDELINRYGEEYHKVLEAQRRLGLGPGGAIRSRRLESAQAATDRYREHVLTRLRSASRLKYPNTPHEALVRRALARSKPFRNTDTGGYRDALLWYSVLGAATFSPTVPVALVTANTRDFSDPANPSQLHPDLVKDLVASELTPASVLLFPSLDRFLQAHVIPTLTVLDDIRARLEAGTFEGLDLRTFTTDDLQPLLGWKEFEPQEIGFPSEYETSHLSMIEEIQQLSDIDVRQLPSNDILISYSLIAECEFDIFIFKADYYSLPDSEMPYVWSPDWNEHYVAASDSSTVRMRIALVFTQTDHAVKSAQISEIEPTEEWWERKERERA